MTGNSAFQGPLPETATPGGQAVCVKAAALRKEILAAGQIPD
jgi:hypothetical protein